MTGPLAFLLVAVGGGLGAAARFWLADSIKARRATELPWGTITVNVLGSFVIGVVAGLLLSVGRSGELEAWRLLVATGLCGGFTTFSTATVETVTLLRAGHLGRALVNTLGTLALTLAAVVAGIGAVALVIP
ncbi:fluoride efflux transporter CrcB [Xylanimonas oleitrophica]|uniref:Fluoride-specific ion channel FluC n=1 Tax=Xylanimonas oleitrophica TaxID=2607479 RepID=A0A2W5WQU6_9MICO|nr:fluoride efflux transporter CrcB [Xylanimonas oleitrophica]PZR53322.1 fluoride efflux transporter CrcB [Xylanimonas oleitrophica]